jgi:folate-dependent phosphoribosylglycinamide formyltransferase PurN
LAQAGVTTNVLYNALANEFLLDPLIVEAPPSKWALLRRRANRLGWLTVAGQILFAVVLWPVLTRRSRERRAEILGAAGLSDREIDAEVIYVRSANDHEVVELLRRSKPQLVLVSGTRVLSASILSAVGCPFINVHAGITPRYRGVHGGYWALAMGDPNGCGVTVHFLDEGIDTGAILAQAMIAPTKQDDFTTYPYLQLAAAIPPLRAAMHAAIGGHGSIGRAGTGTSALWSHPTLWGYVWRRVRHGIR